MSTAVLEKPPVLKPGNARRAVLRWAWRLFRREWRQQALVLALLLVAVAATTIGLGAAVNGVSQASRFGTANQLVTVPDEAGVARLEAAFGPVDVIEHQKVSLPGSANGIDLRAQDPAGPYGRSMLRLDSGRWPGAGEVAVTADVAKIFGLHAGAAWNGRTVAGIVENPLDLRDRFGLVAPGGLTTPDHITVLISASQDQLAGGKLPDGSAVESRGNDEGPATVGVLLLATIGLLFAGLLAVAGFTVLAQRRLRALGMLGAIGASHRHIRLVLVADGAIVGVAGALTGAVAGLAVWFAASPWLGPRLGHRIDPAHLPWTSIGAAVLLAVVTAVGAAWWPARVAARVPVIAALSARPAPPRPAHRWAAAGAVLLAGGLGALWLAEQDKPAYIIGGVLGTGLGLLLFAPAGIAVFGRLAGLAPLAWRLALRDLSRYRARSSAALAAIGLAIGIAATIVLAAGVHVAQAAVPGGGNLPADQLIVWLSPHGAEGAIPSLSAGQLGTAQQAAGAIGARLGVTSTLMLQGATDPQVPPFPEGRPAMMLGKATQQDGRTMYSGDTSVPVYVATPEVLARYGIDPAGIDPAAQILTSRTDLGQDDLFPTSRGHADRRPKLQHVTTLPTTYSSAPAVLMPVAVVQRLNLTTLTVGWLLQAPHALTQPQIDQAQQTAAGAGLSVETRATGADIARLANYATAVGVAVGLGVLAMTVGLIRGETAGDLRTLTAAGARRRTRRNLTAATAGTLALLGALIGTAGAYLAMAAWYHRELHWLRPVPAAQLAAILIGLPILAWAAAWLLAGKEPPAIARRPLD